MEYTTPAPEVLVTEHPTKGRLAFAERVSECFEAYRAEVPNFDASVAVNEDAGMWLDEMIAELDATKLFVTFRDVTGRSTDDIDHASAALYAAAHDVWETLAGDYHTFLAERD